MHLNKFIREESRILTTRIVFMLVFSGLATGLLVSVVNHAADTVLTGEVEGRILFLYLVIFLLYLYTQKYSLAHTIYPFDDALYKFRLRLVEKAMTCEITTIEGLPANELQEYLSREANLAAQLLPWLTYSAQAAAVLAFCLLYLAWLSPAAFVIIGLTLASALLWHLFVEKKIHHEFDELRVQEHRFSSNLETLSRDALEIRTSQEKHTNIFENLKLVSKQSEHLKLVVDKQTISSIMSTRIALFLLLAIFVFIVPVYDPGDAELIFKITVVTFFIMGPVSQLVYALPLLLRLETSMSALYEFEARLDAGNPRAIDTTEAETKAFAPDFHEIRFTSASFAYAGTQPDAASRTLFDDLNLGLRQGEFIFVRGSNHSGKTTLLKLLCGLYPPASGSLYLDKHRVKAAEYPLYRGLFAYVAADAPPDPVLHTPAPPEEGRIEALLEKTGLAEEVEYDHGAFQFAGLSRAYRWRLNLVRALLADKAVYLFDDCALGQDPAFVEMFYQEILEDLRNGGKTVVAVSAHEQFDTFPDRIWEIRDGAIQVVTPDGERKR